MYINTYIKIYKSRAHEERRTIYQGFGITETNISDIIYTEVTAMNITIGI